MTDTNPNAQADNDGTYQTQEQHSHEQRADFNDDEQNHAAALEERWADIDPERLERGLKLAAWEQSQVEKNMQAEFVHMLRCRSMARAQEWFWNEMMEKEFALMKAGK